MISTEHYHDILHHLEIPSLTCMFFIFLLLLSQSLLHALSILEMSSLIVVQDLALFWNRNLSRNEMVTGINWKHQWCVHQVLCLVLLCTITTSGANIIFSVSSIWIHISNTWSFSSAFKHLTSWLLFSLTLWGTDSALNFNWVCSTHFLTFWYHLLWENQY